MTLSMPSPKINKEEPSTSSCSIKTNAPLVVVEAKKESLDPLSAKEQARTYARSIQARYIILSNGNAHYLWDTQYGNPESISRFPSQKSLSQAVEYHPSPIELAKTSLDEYYIIESQMPDFRKDPSFLNPKTCQDFLDKHHLKKLRTYQLNAIKSLQESAKHKKQRFLFEMATGTGKTLVSAAVIKLFLRSGNAQRVLFLVDRLELEDQAFKAFTQYLGKDYTTMIYKDNRDCWTSAQIVVSTIQTFLSGERYRKEFSPTDFELVISDEAHRSIGGNSRVVFEYFVGYKLGLTATPKDYLKGFKNDSPQSQREFERRVLIDTYKTFGCDSGIPTFRYDLLAGVKDGYLINPIIIDARTEITTQLLSDQGLSVRNIGEESQEEEQIFTERDYEKKVFNEATNVAMCKAFIDNALQDPLSVKLGRPVIGKSIIFCVSQKHAGQGSPRFSTNWRWKDGPSYFPTQILQCKLPPMYMVPSKIPSTLPTTT
jgi:type I restriction enzyme, R subunit